MQAFAEMPSQAALANIPLRVHFDSVLASQMLIEPKEAARLLPAATRYGMPGGVIETTTKRRIIFSPEILGPRIGEAPPEWEVYLELAGRVRPGLADRLQCSGTPALREEISRVVPLYRGIEALTRRSKAALEFVENIRPQPPFGPSPLTPAYLFRLQRAMYASQPIFSRTGGSLRALCSIRRVKRCCGARMSADTTPPRSLLAACSCRVGSRPPIPPSYSAAERPLSSCKRRCWRRISKLVSIGAPTSLAVDLARRYGATLASFLPKDRFNVNTGEERIDRGSDGNG